jgi:hypothetical protein
MGMSAREIMDKVEPYRLGASVWVDGGNGRGATSNGFRVPVEILDQKEAYGEVSVLVTAAGGAFPEDAAWKKLHSLTISDEAYAAMNGGA